MRESPKSWTVRLALVLPLVSSAVLAAEVPHHVSDWMPPARVDGIAVDDQGNVYISIRSQNIMQKYAATGDLLISWGGVGSSEGQFSAPIDVLLDADGNVLVADAGWDRIQKFGPDGSFLSMWGWGVLDGSPEYQVCYSGCQAGINGAGSGQFAAVRWLGLGPDGSIYAGDTTNDRVTRFTAGGTILGEWGTTGAGPGQFTFIGDVACDSQGNVYVIDGEPNNRVQKFTASGQYLIEWGGFGYGPGQFDDPSCLGLDDNDIIYVIDLASRKFRRGLG